MTLGIDCKFFKGWEVCFVMFSLTMMESWKRRETTFHGFDLTMKLN